MPTITGAPVDREPSQPPEEGTREAAPSAVENRSRNASVPAPGPNIGPVLPPFDVVDFGRGHLNDRGWAPSPLQVQQPSGASTSLPALQRTGDGQGSRAEGITFDPGKFCEKSTSKIQRRPSSDRRDDIKRDVDRSGVLPCRLRQDETIQCR